MSQQLSQLFNAEPAEILAKADELISAEEIAAGYDRIAAEITEKLADKDPVVMCLMVGGMQPTVEVIKRLTFPLEVDYLHATRYQGDTEGGTLMWKVSPSIDLHNRHVLIIDDILDEGETLEAVLNAINAQEPASISTAMLLEKQHNRRNPNLKADIIGFQVADRYLFGCGLDYKNHFRQFPAVYAVASEHLEKSD